MSCLVLIGGCSPASGPGRSHFRDSISPEFYELEREAVFKRAWLNVARVEELPRVGSYLTKEIEAANASVLIVKGKDLIYSLIMVAMSVEIMHQPHPSTPPMRS